ncbi:MAG TPA: glucuronate isomerase, partial [Oscillospiraceae bacterium]|nr:glucuronate isomerase [Oscillospiraceae bacterium]
GEYHKRGWIMQLHMGTIRNNSDRMFSSLGADTGFDAIRTNFDSSKLSSLLNALDLDSRLPKTILYSLHPADNEVLCSLAGCFQSSDAVGKIQHGSAWWFNDSKTGMISQLTSLANIGVLGTFIGMLTDSRSFLSYTRHEYFRRILCNLFGEWVEKGEYPNDLDSLSKLISDISYNNCKRYFGF